MATLKQLKKALKEAGLKTTGSKRALTRRAKHLMRGGDDPKPTESVKADEKTAEGRLAIREEEEGMKEAEKTPAAASGPAPKPGGSRKRPAKKHSTKKRRHLSASAYRW